MRTRKEILKDKATEIEDKIKDLLKEQQTLQNDIDNLDSKMKRFKVDKGGFYYAIIASFAQKLIQNDVSVVSKEYYINGNMFETEQEAIDAKPIYYKKLEILEEFTDKSKEFEVDKDNYFIGWDYKDNEPIIFNWNLCSASKYCFTKEVAEQLIEKYGQDIKLIFE